MISNACRAAQTFFQRHGVVIGAFAASRLALFAVGLMTQLFIEPASTHGNRLELTHFAALRMWGAWDSEAYVALATHGYDMHAGSEGQANWAYFPAFPMISAAIARLGHLSVFPVMVLVANASFLVALFFIHRLATKAFDGRVADISTALLCAVPGSYIFSSAYTESLFLMALAGCLLALHDRRWLMAGAFAALATLTRNLGIGLLLPMGLAAAGPLRSALRGGPAARPASGELMRIAIGLVLPAAALAGFCLYLYHRTGDPFAFATVQKGWGRRLQFPLLRPLLAMKTGIADSDMLSFAAAWVSIGLTVALGFMRRWSLFALALFLTLVPLASGLLTYARYSLVVLPIFLAAAALLASRPAMTQAMLVFLATINGFMMVAWTLDLWLAA